MLKEIITECKNIWSYKWFHRTLTLLTVFVWLLILTHLIRPNIFPWHQWNRTWLWIALLYTALRVRYRNRWLSIESTSIKHKLVKSIERIELFLPQNKKIINISSMINFLLIALTITLILYPLVVSYRPKAYQWLFIVTIFFLYLAIEINNNRHK